MHQEQSFPHFRIRSKVRICKGKLKGRVGSFLGPSKRHPGRFLISLLIDGAYRKFSFKHKFIEDASQTKPPTPAPKRPRSPTPPPQRPRSPTPTPKTPDRNLEPAPSRNLDRNPAPTPEPRESDEERSRKKRKVVEEGGELESVLERGEAEKGTSEVQRVEETGTEEVQREVDAEGKVDRPQSASTVSDAEERTILISNPLLRKTSRTNEGRKPNLGGGGGKDPTAVPVGKKFAEKKNLSPGEHMDIEETQPEAGPKGTNRDGSDMNAGEESFSAPKGPKVRLSISPKDAKKKNESNASDGFQMISLVERPTATPTVVPNDIKKRSPLERCVITSFPRNHSKYLDILRSFGLGEEFENLEFLRPTDLTGLEIPILIARKLVTRLRQAYNALYS
ncbi:hypothetical protein AAMO2058_001507800 [Amorphochlora amoebiformis]